VGGWDLNTQLCAVSLKASIVYSTSRVAEPHHFYAAPGKIFDASQVPAPALSLLCSKLTF
jgi:hypothetical protein